MNPKVDAFLSQPGPWRAEFARLRSIVLDCQLTEELKWGQPCYTFQGKNVLMLYGFKEYCGLGFFKGALLDDVAGILQQQGADSQAVRLVRFTNLEQIIARESLLKVYIHAALEVEKSGRKVDFKAKRELVFPDELHAILEADAGLKEAFFALTPGRQRAYNLYFTGAKQSPTRISRIEKSRERILLGKGPQDCICGLSKRMPRCDGSHKNAG